MESKKIIIGYYMKGETKKFKEFSSEKQARLFCLSLYENTNCEFYGRERYKHG